jgi:beta-glucanase (GH16 family)
LTEYGQCGIGAYCLGGCDPKYSNSLDSCVPAPVCKSDDYKLSSLSGITSNTKYLGDASKSNWVSSGTPLTYGGNLLLTMPPDSVGTLLASTHYVWYGKITAKLKTSRGAGVVTAFILLSDVKDEIDFEFVGVDLETAQTNFYFQGITNCTFSPPPIPPNSTVTNKPQTATAATPPSTLIPFPTGTFTKSTGNPTV